MTAVISLGRDSVKGLGTLVALTLEENSGLAYRTPAEVAEVAEIWRDMRDLHTEAT